MEKYHEVMREIAMCERVYGRHGEPLPLQRRRIAIMEAIAADYAEAAKRERLL